MTITRRRFLTFGLPAVALLAAAGCDNSKKTDQDPAIKAPPPTPLKGREPPGAKK